MILNNLPVPASSSTGNDDGWIDYTEEHNSLHGDNLNLYKYKVLKDANDNDVIVAYCKVKDSVKGTIYVYLPEGYSLYPSDTLHNEYTGYAIYTNKNLIENVFIAYNPMIIAPSTTGALFAYMCIVQSV